MPKKARLENLETSPIIMTEQNYLAMLEGKKEFLKILPTWNQTTWGEFTHAHKEAMLKDNQFIYQLWFFDYLTKMYEFPSSGLPMISKAQQNKLFLSFVAWLDIQDLKLLYDTCQKMPHLQKLTWKTWDEILVLTQHRKSLNNSRLITQALLKMCVDNHAAEQFQELRKEVNFLEYRANPFDKIHDLDPEQVHVLHELLKKFTKNNVIEQSKKLTEAKSRHTFIEVTAPDILTVLKRNFSRKIRASLAASSTASSSAASTPRHSIITEAKKPTVSVFSSFGTMFPRIPTHTTPSTTVPDDTNNIKNTKRKR